MAFLTCLFYIMQLKLVWFELDFLTVFWAAFWWINLEFIKRNENYIYDLKGYPKEPEEYVNGEKVNNE